MYGTSGFAEKLNIQNFVELVRNCVKYKCTEYGFADKLKNPDLRKFKWEIVYIKCMECLVLQRNSISKIL